MFDALPIETRIDAVFGDGMYYTVDKAAKLARCDREAIVDWIKAQPKICQVGESYRVPGYALQSLWDKHGWTGERALVPGVYPPRVVNGRSEPDVLEEAPLRTVATAVFRASDELVAKVQLLIAGMGVVHHEVLYNRYRIIAATGAVIEHVFNQVDELQTPPIRWHIRRREIAEISPEWLRESVPFYIQYLKDHMPPEALKTILAYCRDEDDKENYIQHWVFHALERIDESQGVPLGGFLCSMLPRWVHDVPQERLGRNETLFERSLLKLKKAGVDDEVELAEALGVDVDTIRRHNAQIATFKMLKESDTLTWEEDGVEERPHTSLYPELNPEIDTETSLVLIQAMMDINRPDLLVDVVKAMQQGTQASLPEVAQQAIMQVLTDTW